MKSRLPFLLAAAVSATALAAVAAEGDKAKSSQQNRMAQCSHDAKEKGLKGEERQKYMSTCLKGGAAKASEKEAPRKNTAAAK